MVTSAVRHLALAKLPAATEVPFLHRSIDLVYRREDNALVSVEFKKRDWQRALIQARDHRLGTPFAYVCVPQARITMTIQEAAREWGVGVMAWSLDAPLTEVVPPASNWDSAQGLGRWLAGSFKSRLEEAP